MRADYNVPIEDGVITDDYRLQQSLPTIKYILDNGASLVLVSHLGRPKSSNDKKCSLEIVAKRLGELLEREVIFAKDCIGEPAKTATKNLKPGSIVLLENLRYHKEEEANDESFAKAIIESTGAQLFVQDGFGVVHRAHASTDAIARQDIMAVAGLLLEKEVDTITNVMQHPVRPLVAVVGGAKISDKIEILQRLLEFADIVAVGGAMANDFLKAEGINIGKSVFEAESVDIATDILERAREIEKTRAFNFLVPVDVVVSTDIDGDKPTRIVDLTSHTIADITSYPKTPSLASHSVGKDEMILDIGPMSAERIAGTILLAKTVLWNGTMGVTETDGLSGAQEPFEHATKIVVDAMIGASVAHNNTPYTVVGGGDTVGYVEDKGLIADFNHVSTGGGASLELMSGRELPGVKVLWDK